MPSEFSSHDPCTGQVVWTGAAAMADEVGRAIDTARAAQRDWAAQSLDQRENILTAFARHVQASAELVDAKTACVNSPSAS